MPSRLPELAIALAVMTVSSCGSDAMSQAEQNFVAQMTPHHQLGIHLNEIAALRAEDVRLRRMVFEMSGYHRGDMAHLDHWSADQDIEPASDYPGHIDDAVLSTLETSTGDSFDTAWIDAMIEHHEGALQIAHTVLESRPRDEVRSLAQQTITVQSAEINELRALLDDLLPLRP